MLEFIFGRANSGKTEYIYNRISQDVLKGEQPVILIVPEQSTFDSERKLVTALGAAGSALVEVTSFSRLADMIFEELGGEYGAPLDESMRIIFMTRALDEVRASLKLYGRHAASTEFVQAVLLALDELKQTGLTAQEMLTLSRTAPTDSLSAMLHDFAMIAAAYEGLLGESRTDSVDRLTMLYDMLADSDFFDGKRVYFDGFDGFTGQQYKLIDRILSRSADVILAFPADSGEERADGYGTFSNVKAAARRIARFAASHGVRRLPDVILEKSYFSAPALTALELDFAGLSNEPYTKPCDEVTLISAANAYDEVRYTARTIRRMVREMPGVRYRDFVIIARDISQYADLLESVFSQFDIPLFLDNNRPAAVLPLMTFVHASVAAAVRFSTDDIFRFLKTGLTALSDDDISELENYAFIWNLSGDAWRAPFTLEPDGFDDGRRDAQASAQRLAHLNELRAQIIAPLEKLRTAALSNRPRTLVRAIYPYIQQTGADVRLKQLTDRFASAGDGETADLYRQSYDALMQLLGQLDTAFADAQQPIAATLELLQTLFGALDLGRIPQKLDTVAAGSAEKFRPGRPKYTFVLGMNQGSFPAVKSCGLISQANRARLGEMNIPLDDRRLSDAIDESYLVYKILFSCYSGLFVSYLRADAQGKALEPSSAVERIRTCLPNCRRLDLDWQLLPEAELPECAADALAVAAPHWQNQTEAVGAIREALADTPYADRLCAMDQAQVRKQARLDVHTAKQLYGTRMTLSASRVDTFHRCQFSYFCKYGLQLKPLRRAQLDAMQRGTAVHYVLDGLIRKYGAAYHATTAEVRHVEVARLLQSYRDALLRGKQSDDAQLDYMLRRMQVLLCELSDRLHEEFCASGFTPRFSELTIGFGADDPVPALHIPLSAGEINIVGAVDRVDTLSLDGSLIFRVIDYKTGSRSFKLPDVLYGLNMQMLIYMTAIQRGGICGSAAQPAGILYMPAKRSIAAGANGHADAQKSIRMNGLIVDSKEILDAMEPNRGNNGRFIKMRFKGDGSPYADSDTVSAQEMSLIESHVTRKIAEMGEALLAGEIAAQPMDGRESAACAYCDYSDICHIKSADAQKVPSMKNEQVKQILREEAEHGI